MAAAVVVSTAAAVMVAPLETTGFTSRDEVMLPGASRTASTALAISPCARTKAARRSRSRMFSRSARTRDLRRSFIGDRGDGEKESEEREGVGRDRFELMDWEVVSTEEIEDAMEGGESDAS